MSVNVNTIQCRLCPDVTSPVISGSLGQLIVERGRLPEDLSLHYHLQVLEALEYLVKKKVAHLDIKGTLQKKRWKTSAKRCISHVKEV